MKIKGIGRPCKKANEKKEPVPCTELHKQADRVLDGFRCLPLGVSLARLVGHDDTLFPSEKIAKGLLRGGDDAIRNWLRWLIMGGTHICK